MACHINDLIDENIPVVAIGLPFRVVRDIGSSLIFDGGIESLISGEITTKYPQHKKMLRNIMYAIDALVRKDDSQPNAKGKRQRRIVLYSTSCDEYDLISITY